MKKITSLLLAVIIALSVCVPSFAQENASPISEVNVTMSENNGEEYVVPPATEKDTLVRIYLCSKLNPGNVGHIFVYMENLTDEPVKVGLITLEKNQGVSMGAFGLQRSDGWGVYYNTESYRFKEADYNSIVALCDELDASHLQKLNKYLQNHNHWDLIINCAFFAVGAWNSCTNDFVLPTSIPTFSRWQIQLRHYTTLLQMYVPPRENVYYVNGNGKNAKLQICSDESIDR